MLPSSPTGGTNPFARPPASEPALTPPTPEVSVSEEEPTEETSLALQVPAGPTIIDTSQKRAHGLSKCPKCGSSDVALDTDSGLLVCKYCRNSWSEESFEKLHDFTSDLASLTGSHITSGAQSISADAEDIVTVECQGCGAEVVLNTVEQVQQRCHWCRQVLSLNSQVPNGAVPDALVPFSITHAEAVDIIAGFARKRRFFAHRRFRQEFAPENVLGVYMPYMVVDGNMAVELAGEGEIETARYTRTEGVGDNKRTVTYYDADVYTVERRFSMLVDDLITESSAARSNMGDRAQTNNILNAVLPFDVKQAVLYNSHYLSGFTSEKRDLNVEELTAPVEENFLSIGRAEAERMVEQYDRGVAWQAGQVTTKGVRWVAVYLPVWLYSYYEKKGEGGLLHYIAVNGQNGKVMGSIPLNMAKLIAFSTFAGMAGLGGGLAASFTGSV